MRKIVFWIVAGVLLAVAGGLLYGSEGIFYGAEERQRKEQEKKEENADASSYSDGFYQTGDETHKDRDEIVSDCNVCTEDEEQTIRVYVCGAVVNPGVYEFTEGSILCDAIDAAGGFLPEAETRVWNLAEYIYDTEQICIPTKEEASEVVFAPEIEPKSEEYGTNRVNINTAGMKELLTLTGIGETKAKAILSYREANGPFSCTADIKKVSGIGDAIYSLIAMEIKVE